MINSNPMKRHQQYKTGNCLRGRGRWPRLILHFALQGKNHGRRVKRINGKRYLREQQLTNKDREHANIPSQYRFSPLGLIKGVISKLDLEEGRVVPN